MSSRLLVKEEATIINNLKKKEMDEIDEREDNLSYFLSLKLDEIDEIDEKDETDGLGERIKP